MEEVALWRAYGDSSDTVARERLFSFYYPFARRVARSHFLDRTGGDIEFADLCQHAATGLLEAIDRFDPARGVPFEGYAKRRVSGAILNGIVKSSEFREQLSFQKRLRSDRVRSLSSVEATSDSTTEAMEALAQLAVDLAIGFMLDEAGLVHAGDAVASGDAYETLAWRDVTRQIASTISTLDPRSRMIIRQHYVHGLEFNQIASLLGVTKGRVSQLHRGAIETLRKRLPRRDHFTL